MWVRKQMAVGEPEGILHVARGMLGRNVERVEIVIFGLHFGAVQHREAERSEQVLDFVLDDGDRMQAAGPGLGRGKRQVQPFLFEAGIQRSRCKCLFSCLKRSFERLFCGVEGLPGDLPLFGRELADVDLREQPLAPEHVHAHFFERVQVLCLFNARQRARLQFLDFLFDHCAYSSSSVHHCLMAFGHREIHRVLLIIGARIDIRASAQEQPHHLHVPILRCGVQRRPSAVLARVDVGAVL